MRKSKQELLEWCPGWNEKTHDIVKVFYADIPLTHYDEGEYQRYQAWAKESSELGAIGGVEAYIYAMNGTYDIYHTFMGDIKIHEDGNVLCGDITFKVGQSKYTLAINRMYGWNGLSIHKHHHDIGCIAFVNNNGGGATSAKIKELDKDIVEKVLNKEFPDYGIGVQKFMEAAREVYKIDPVNHILERPFICSR